MRFTTKPKKDKKMKKVQVALDFITLYKSHKKGEYYYPKTKQEENQLKDKEKARNRLKKL